MQLTRKLTKRINADYTSEGTVPQNVDKIKYLGESITEDFMRIIYVISVLFVMLSCTSVC